MPENNDIVANMLQERADEETSIETGALYDHDGDAAYADDEGTTPQKPDEDEKPNGDTPPDGGNTDDPEKEKPTTINFSEVFTDYSDVDEVKKFANRGREFTPEVENELKDLRQSKSKFETLEEKEKKVNSINPYKNEKLYRLDKLMETNPDDAAFYSRLMFGEPTAEEVVKLDLIRQHPELFKEDPEALEFKLKRKYPGVFSGEYEPEDPEYKDDLMQMKMDAKSIRKIAEDEMSKIDIPNLQADAEKQKEANRAFVESWKPHTQKVLDGLTKLPIIVKDSEGKDVIFKEFEIPENDREQYQKVALQHIIDSHLEPTQENIDFAVKVARGVYLADNFSTIMSDALDSATEEQGSNWRKNITNSKKLGGEEKPVPVKPSTGDSKDDLWNAIKKSSPGI